VTNYIYLAIIFIALGGIFLYRAVTGTSPATGPVTLSNSQAPGANKRQRWMNTAVGIAFVSFGLIYLVLAYLRHTHS
jgi:hypothetical protein